MPQLMKTTIKKALKVANTLPTMHCNSSCRYFKIHKTCSLRPVELCPIHLFRAVMTLTCDIYNRAPTDFFPMPPLAGCIMYSTTSGHQGISSPPSEGKKYHIRHSAVYMKSKQRVLSLFLQNGWKFKIGLLFCCYIVMTDAFRYALLAFLFAVIV